MARAARPGEAPPASERKVVMATANAPRPERGNQRLPRRRGESRTHSRTATVGIDSPWRSHSATRACCRGWRTDPGESDACKTRISTDLLLTRTEMGFTRHQTLGKSRSRLGFRQTCCKWATWRSIRVDEGRASSSHKRAKAGRLRGSSVNAAELGEGCERTNEDDHDSWKQEPRRDDDDDPDID